MTRCYILRFGGGALIGRAADTGLSWKQFTGCRVIPRSTTFHKPWGGCSLETLGMFLNSIGTALPLHRYTKADCWDAFRASEWFERLGARAHTVAQSVLRRDNGIEERWLAVDSLNDVFSIDPDTLHRRFSTHAPRLAAKAGSSALM